ncbi:MAG: M23 family metallopeptidase [Balneolaceae bacterium]
MPAKNRILLINSLACFIWSAFILSPLTGTAQDWRLSAGYSLQNVGFKYIPNSFYDGETGTASKGILEAELERYLLYRLYIAGKAEYLFQNQKSYVIGGPVNFQQANIGASIGLQWPKTGVYAGVKAGRVWDINMMGQDSNDEVTWIPPDENADRWTTAFTGGIKYYLLSFLRLQLEVTKTTNFPEAVFPAQTSTDQPAFKSFDFNPISVSLGISISIPWNSKKRLERLNNTGSLPILSAGSVSFSSPIRKGAMITSGYGPRWNTTHQGVDIDAQRGESIYAAANGVVIKAGTGSGYGKMVKVQHSNGYSTVYAHLRRVKVKEGQKVRKGDVIGKAGNTGTSSGVHLHFEILKNNSAVDPQSYVRF